MAACSAAMPSYTYAIKAEKLLKARGFPCKALRNEELSREGCGYSLAIDRGCTQALEILSSYSIPYTLVSGGGE